MIPHQPHNQQQFELCYHTTYKTIFFQYLYILYTLHFASYLLQVDINITKSDYRSTLMKSSCVNLLTCQHSNGTGENMKKNQTDKIS